MLEHIKAFFAKLPVRNMSKRKVLATVSALVVIVSVVTITAFAAAATYKVTVNEAGKKTYTVSTRADSVEKFVEDNADALSLGKYDYLDTSSFEVGENCTVTVLRAQVIKVIDNGEEHFLNGAGPAAQMLDKHNMALGKFDEINLADNEFVSSDKTLEIKRSFGVTVIADGKSNDVQIASGTVKDAVARAGGQPHAIDLYGAVQRCKHGRFYQIIGIDHADVVAAGVVQPGVTGVGRAAVRLVEHPDTGILLCQCVADRGGAVVAAVIDKQQLKVGERLGQNALHSRAQVRPRVVDCGDYADFGMVGHRLFLI